MLEWDVFSAQEHNGGAKKLVGVKVCLTFGDERLPLSKMEDPIGF